MHVKVSYHARRIMSYLEINPHSMDTAEGIMRWWINDSDYDLATVNAALDLLEREGKVKRDIHNDGEHYFSLIFQ